ncbi:MAG: methionyl-tRNA formyltransferase [Candidatus Aureabacteria bacterium]|nr:methionyl-tRNA formyltransferase [Candidatus Auribacterota bacterium]
MSPLRLVFMGTPEFAASHLEGLIKCPEFEIAAVYTPVDKPRGRSRTPVSCPVKGKALKHGLKVIQISTLKTEEQAEQLRLLSPDIVVVVAFGFLLPDAILSIPSYGCVNIHPSLLPKYRGAAPIQHALLNGDDKTGVTSMLIDAGMDSGPILMQKEVRVSFWDDFESLSKKLVLTGIECLKETLVGIRDSKMAYRGIPQDNRSATYTEKIKPEMASLDFTKSALMLHNQIRALNEWPGCRIRLKAQEGDIVLKIWKSEVINRTYSGAPGEIILKDNKNCFIVCGEDMLSLLDVQPEGKRRMAIGSFLNGHKIISGSMAEKYFFNHL